MNAPTRHTQRPRIVLFLSMWIFIVGCASFATFDQHAYLRTTSIKVDALNLIAKADSSYENHITEIHALRTELRKLYEYERGRPDNEITVQMWNILMSPKEHLLGGFLARWEEEGELNPTFIEEASKIIADAFDQISGLESQKIKKSDIKNDEVFNGLLEIGR